MPDPFFFRMRPRMKETIERYWDWRSATYHNEFSAIEEQERAVWRKALQTSLPDNHRMNVLDIGTGPGLMALTFAEMGHTVTAVDISSGMLNQAQKNARRLNLGISFMQGDAEALPYKDGHFDVIVSKYLIWTLPSPERFIAECNRLLSDRGALIAIDGMWYQKSGLDRVRDCVAQMIRCAEGRDYSKTFEQYYGGIKKYLPLYNKNSPEMISSLFMNAGLSGVSVRYLNEFQDFQRKYAPIQYRIKNTNPVFMVIGKKE